MNVFTTLQGMQDQAATYALAIIAVVVAGTVLILHDIHAVSTRIGDKIMAAIDDLKAADQAETAEIATVGQALTDAITRIGTITVPPGATDEQIAAVNADLASHLADLRTIAASLATIAPAPAA